MKKLFLFLFLLFTPNILYAQEIIGGPSSPNLSNIPPYSLVELTLKSPDKISSVTWLALTVKDNKIVNTQGIIFGNNFVFTGPPGDYFILCQAVINNASVSVNSNVTIKSSQPPIPLPVGKVYIAIVTDSSNPVIPPAYFPTLKQKLNPNFIWKSYDLNSQVSDGKGNLIPLSSTPWGKAAIKTGLPSVTLIDSKGNVLNSFPFPSDEQAFLDKLK